MAVESGWLSSALAQPSLSFPHWLPAPGAPRTLGVHPEGTQKAAHWGQTPAAFTQSLETQLWLHGELHGLIAQRLIPFPRKVWLLATYTQFKCHQYLSTLNGSHLGCSLYPPGTLSYHTGCLPWQKTCVIVPVPFIAQYRGKRPDQMFQFVCQGDSAMRNCASQSKHQKQHHP